MQTYRIFVEKYPEFQVEAQSLRNELNENLSLNLRTLRLINVYDLDGFTPELLEKCRYTVFGETVTDSVSDSCPLEGRRYLAVEYIPGQFDQRASSALDCVHLIDPDAEVKIRSSRLLIFDDELSDEGLAAIRHYYINAVEAREKDLAVTGPAGEAAVRPMRVPEGFTSMDDSLAEEFCRDWGLAMSGDDLREVLKYFRAEGREPNETELRILDTYWSDHCRHTTFNTHLGSVSIEDSPAAGVLKASLAEVEAVRKELGRSGKPLSLMEIATLGARCLRSRGLLPDLEESEENNACSIYVDVDVDGAEERWLLQFKNETHNHPTEIEPFGGASTCLGGAIRDPLSGRAYVYQAMRVTGAGDITAPVSAALKGKLPQSVISRKAAAGYSSYGNQIGLATAQVREIFHDGFVAKRLEIGAVAGAVKASNVRRESPSPGDVILLLGGRTGRDGIGGATGSSKVHTDTSLEECGSEVQKGNAPEERKLQRLFRRPDAARMIKKSNDFGAGGVSVAIGELAPGLDIRLDAVPVKYEGLNATELAISESQERMAVVVEAADREAFTRIAQEENIEVSYVADVTSTDRMRMFWKGEVVADLSRAFIDSAGAPRSHDAVIRAVEDRDPFALHPEGEDLKSKLFSLMGSRNVASQQGLSEMFDSSIGRSTVLLPYGGLTQSTEAQVSVQKLPVDGYTDTASIMAFGYNPDLSSWSPCHGAAYAVVEACAKVVAAGGDYSRMRFSFQEYFERLGSDPRRWGEPLAALLGAFRIQLELGLPAIGGKDSMSGTFEHLDVPPTLVAFGITTVKAPEVISPEFKWGGDGVWLVKCPPAGDRMPDTALLKSAWDYVHAHILSGEITAAYAVGFGGVAEALVKMSLGNRFSVKAELPEEELFSLSYGSIVVEASSLPDAPFLRRIGTVLEGEDGIMHINGTRISLDRLEEAYRSRYAKVYPETAAPRHGAMMLAPAMKARRFSYPGEPVDKPLVYIPVFPGTNCDYDTAKAFRKAGAEVRMVVFRNLGADDVRSSIDRMCRELSECHIFAIAGGFSAGDEPDGSGKFIASVLRNSLVAGKITELLERGGLILGICNGFQALIKSGLLPYGRPGAITRNSPTLFRNDINRHVARMATTRVASVNSPWLSGFKPGDLHTVAFSHGEGKFVVGEEEARRLFEAGQVAFQYADPVSGEPTMESPWNPNGSYYAIEGIVSPDGQILGKMGHSERYEDNLFRNMAEDMDQPIFANAVNYFKKR